MTIIYANIYGFALTVVMTMGRVLLNERVPLEMQGRVFAAQIGAGQPGGDRAGGAGGLAGRRGRCASRC